MPYVTLGIFTLALAYGAFFNGGVPILEWNTTLIALGLASALNFILAPRRTVPRLDRQATVASAAFLSAALLQLVPLPLGVLSWLSPARVEVARAAGLALNTEPRFATLTSTPYETAGYILTIAAYLLIFLTVRDLAYRFTHRPWLPLLPLLLLGLLESLLGIVQALGSGAAAIGTYASRDHYSGLLEMILPLAAMYAIAVLVRDRSRHESPAGPALKACALLGVAAAVLVAIVHSLCRTGFLVALASVFVVAAIAVSLRGWRNDLDAVPSRWRRWLPVAIVGLVVSLGFVYLPTDPLIARFSEFAKTDDISADTRLQIWRDTAGLVKAYPLFGCGLGGYESAFLRFKSVAPMNTVDYAHNDYLQVLAEMGITGFAIGSFFVFWLLSRGLRGTVYARSVDERYLAIACIGSMTAMLLHSLVDFNMYVPVNGAVFAWVAGMAGVHCRRRA